MTTQSAVERHVWRGYGIAAKNLGVACPWFRPNGIGNPVAPANALGTIPAAFDTSPTFKFNTPSKYGAPTFYGLFDPTGTVAGDYLVEPRMGPFFIASIEPLHPPLMVNCNRVLTVTRAGQQPPGPAYYGGASAGVPVPIATGWPAALVLTIRGEAGETKLPGDMKQGMFMVYLPFTLPLDPLPSDIITDDEEVQNRYIVSAAESTNLGWRLHVRMVST